MRRHNSWLAVLLGLVVLVAPAAGHAGQTPELVWSPSSGGSFDYGTVAGGRTIPQAFMLTNSGASATGTLDITVTGSPAFVKSGDGCSYRSLGPSKSCTVTVEYHPGAAGAGETATLLAKAEKSLASLTLTGEAAVSGHIYWTNIATGSIGRADLDGSNVDESFITGGSSLTGLSADSSHIYWIDQNRGAIGRADVDGSNVNHSFMTGEYNAQMIVASPSFLYWTEQLSSWPGEQTIRRGDLDGTNASTFIGALTVGAFGVAVDANYIYWTNSFTNTIGRARLDGSDVDENFIAGGSQVAGVDVDANYIYWANQTTGTIGRANLDGTNVNQNFITSGWATDVAVTGTNIYWTGYPPSIGRADLDGSNVNPNFITASYQPWALTAVGD